MNEAFLGLGGNMGNRSENLRKALEEIQQHCGTILKSSGTYETAAWGSDSDKKYHNKVVKIQTHLDAEQLLEKTLEIEKNLGRVRSADQNSDRTMDIDILLFNDLIIELKHIQIPHPRLHLRKFVLIPLCEIESSFVHPVLKKTIQLLLEECEDKLDVRLLNQAH